MQRAHHSSLQAFTPPGLGFATLTGLKPDAEYHYRVVAVNEAGTSYGEDASFEAK